MLAEFCIDEEVSRSREWRLCRAHRADDGVKVLLKISAPDETGLYSRSLQQEYSRLSHVLTDAVYHPLDCFVDTAGAVMVFSDFDGGSLEALLRQGRMEPQDFLVVARLLAGLLAKAHEEDLAFYRLSPSSILIQSDRSAAVLMQCPRTMPDSFPTRRCSKEEWAYLSPELTGRLNQPIDHRSDLYSLGMILYRMLVGHPPFEAEDSREWIHCHVARPPRHPHDSAPETPRIPGDIVMKLLSKHPDDRYHTARGLLFDLEQCMGDGTIRQDSFGPGSKDASAWLRIPQKLYGREQETDILLRTFANTADSGWPSHAIVTGQAGIGKTLLVKDMQREVLKHGGYFISGKFDQFEVATPYATIAQAFQDLVQQILGECEAGIGVWRKRLLDSLAEGGQLVIDLVPQLEQILGPQPPLPPLPPLEEGNRFLHIFRQFLTTIARPEHPLVIFLDDMQWTDPGSLNFIEHLLTSPDTAHLMVITAYRNDEVTAFSSLSRTLLSIRKRIQPVEIHLGPLPPGALRDLLADALHVTPLDCSALALQISLKTGGNPFFVNQFLHSLHHEGSIFFDAEACRWRWDAPRIEASTVTNNVVDLMAQKIRRLDPLIQTLLKTAACIGNRFYSSSLASILEMEHDEVARLLAPAVSEGLLLVSPPSHQSSEASLSNGPSAPRLEYHWPHDRVQQAAYLLIPREERNAIHLRIGRALLKSPELEESIFDLVNQLNHGVAFIRDPAERKSLSQLNVRAGEKARKAVAYTSAREYLAMAIALLAPDAWETAPDETLKIFLDLSECHFLSGNRAEAEHLFSDILKHAGSPVERARVYLLQIRLFAACGQYGDGLNLTRQALAMFGVTFPDSDAEVQALFMTQHERIQDELVSRSIASLADAPRATDPEVCTVLRLLSEGVASAYNASPSLMPVFVTTGLTFSLRAGLTVDSAPLFAFYSVLLVGLFRNISAAWEFSLLALHLNEQYPDARSRGMLLYLHAAFIFPWKRPIRFIHPVMAESFKACISVGDYVYAGFNRNEVVWQAFDAGTSIDDVLTLSLDCAAFTRQTRNDMQHKLIGLQQQFLLTLKGERPAPFRFDTPEILERDCLESFADANFGCGLGFFHIMKQIVSFLQGRYEDALHEARQTLPLLPAVMGLSIEASHYFFSSLTLAAVIPSAPEGSRGELTAWLHANLRILGIWSASCPEGFAHRYDLVGAELARIEGKEMEAEHLYEKAIRSAHENGFLQNEAIANDLAARFFAGRSLDRIAATYAREARACFAGWGCLMMVDRQTLPDASRPGDVPPGPVDVRAMLRVSRAISGEILLDRLINTLMQAALDTSGAQVAFFFNVFKDGWALAAEAREVARKIQILHATDRNPLTRLVPEALVEHTRKSGEMVVIADAERPHPFSSDRYLATIRPGSAVCLPITRQGRMSGILYVENSTTPNAFPPEHLLMLEAIASQAAISIENARLYSDLKRENIERRTSEEQIRHMAHHDALTALPNRLLFRDRVEQSISQAHRNNEIVAILFFDIDHFKDINDSLGHQIGDHLLQQTGLRLQRCLREGDTVARLGGDEFIFCLPALHEIQEIIPVAERILSAVRKPFHLDRYRLNVTGSLGVSVYPGDGEDADSLMRTADAAMYHAKGSGRDNFKFYTAELNDAAHRRVSLANQLVQAIDEHRIAVFYQPLVDLSTGQISSAEALIRLLPRDGEMLLPGDFIGIAEETGLIVPLDEWVLEEACSQLRQWHDVGHSNLRISVNLSPRQFRIPGFPGRAASILGKTGIQPSAIDIEISEGLLTTKNRENVANLEELAGLGVRLSVDDFGTGTSSLAFLQRFPIAALKIDRSFIQGLHNNPGHTTIVKTIIAMARTLQLEVIAEGVETQEQLDFLKNCGCGQAQGYYFSQPVPAAAFTRLLTARA